MNVCSGGCGFLQETSGLDLAMGGADRRERASFARLVRKGGGHYCGGSTVREEAKRPFTISQSDEEFMRQRRVWDRRP